jgi:hypothetical protein
VLAFTFGSILLSVNLMDPYKTGYECALFKKKLSDAAELIQFNAYTHFLPSYFEINDLPQHDN